MGETRVLAEGRHLRFVERDGWEFSDRVHATWAAVIVPVTPEGRLVFVEQFRIPVNARCIEFPAGLVGDLPGAEHEPVVEAARRELLEETGYEAVHWEYLTAGPPSPGLSSERIELFLATALKKTGPGGGHTGEHITVHEVPLESAEQWLEEMMREGRMIDPKIFAGLYFARERTGLR